jgi:hypothetical protein
VFSSLQQHFFIWQLAVANVITLQFCFLGITEAGVL